MLDLPVEIVISIISNLKLHDKLQCIRVCQRWYSVIYSSNLFESLLIEDEEQLTYAATTFKFRPELSCQLKKLSVKPWRNMDPYLLPQLPLLCPYLTNIDIWSGPIDWAPVTSIEIPLWDNLETLKDNTGLQLSNIMLRSPRLHLRYLELSCSNDRWNWNDFKAILEKVPALEELRLVRVENCSLDDLEIIHNATPQLKVFKMSVCDLYGGVQGHRKSIQSAAVKLSTFSIEIEPEDTEPIPGWISYFGRKYPNLQDIAINHTMLWEDQEYGPHLVKMLQKMPHLKSIDIGIAPLNKDMLMYNLDRIGITATEQMEELDLLMSSQSTHNIKSLEIGGDMSTINKEREIWIQKLLRASDIFTNLRDLSITRLHADSTFLMGLVTCLPRLKSLKFGFVYFKDNRFIPVKPVATAIQFLSVQIFTYNQENTVGPINHMIEFLLNSCPLLEAFKFENGEEYTVPFGGICLDFRDHPQLKSIEVQARQGQYFKFNHIPEKKDKRWKSYHTEVEDYKWEGRWQEDEPHFNVKWNGKVDLNLKSY